MSARFPARHRLQGLRLAGPLLGGCLGIRARAAPRRVRHLGRLAARHRASGRVSWESARTASSIPAVTARVSGSRWCRTPRWSRTASTSTSTPAAGPGRPTGRPARHPQAASRRRGQAAGGSRGHVHRSPERRWPRSLRGGDEGPRGQRVRHQLTPGRLRHEHASWPGSVAVDPMTGAPTSPDCAVSSAAQRAGTGVQMAVPCAAALTKLVTECHPVLGAASPSEYARLASFLLLATAGPSTPW